jgi:predicted  nucleic acid-binding Zn-ribbon protein
MEDGLIETEAAITDGRKREEEQTLRLRALEREIRELEAKRVQLQSKRDQVKDNKVFQALNAEIEGATSAIDAKETEALRVLESLEGQQAEIMQLQDKLSSLRQEIETRRRDLQTTSEKAVLAAEELAREIETCTSQLPPPIVATLARLRTGLELPAVRIDGEACGGCHAHFPQQVALEIDKGRSVVRCQACGRYVVPLG